MNIQNSSHSTTIASFADAPIMDIGGIRKTKNRPRLFQDIMMPNLWEESSVFSTIAHLIVTINNLLVKSIIHLPISSSFLVDGGLQSWIARFILNDRK